VEAGEPVNGIREKLYSLLREAVMLRGIASVVVSTLLFGVLLFGSAGRWDLPMFWAYLAVNLAIGLAGMLIMAERSPDLIQYRTRLGASDIPDRLYRWTEESFGS